MCHECGLLVPLASSRERLDNNIGFSLRIKLFFFTSKSCEEVRDAGRVLWHRVQFIFKGHQLAVGTG